MTKSDLREKYMEQRKTLSQDEVLSLSAKIFDRFEAYFQPVENQKVHVFLPIKKFKEIETSIFTDSFFANKIRVFVPKVVGNELITVEWEKNLKLTENSWGISEPESNLDSGEKNFDFVLTPLLYCDSFGHRVGYGKGFYDVFFKNLPKKTLKIGLNFFPPNETVDDVWENDIPLDYLVTPTEVLSFRGGTSKFTK